MIVSYTTVLQYYIILYDRVRRPAPAAPTGQAPPPHNVR